MLGPFFFYAHAQAPAEEVYDFRVYFPFDDATFRPDYLSNQKTLDKLGRVLEKYGTDQVSNVEIRAYSSPEGTVSYNRRLSQRRAASMRSYLVQNWPELSSKLTLSPGIEAWDDFRKMVEADTLVSEASKARALAIFDRCGDNPEQLKKEIMRLGDFRRHYAGYFTTLRYSCFRLTFPVDIEEPQPRETAAIEIPELVSTPALAPKTELLASVPEVQPARVRWPLFAVSTNLLQDALITPNFMIEVPIGKRWSIYGEYTFPWWVNKKNNMAWEMLKWDLGVRYWPFYKPDESDPMDILRGHFFGVDLSGGYYDVEPKHTGYQGEFILVGVEYGYAWKLARDWRLDAFIGVGWMGSQFRYYSGDATDQHLIYQHSGKFNWFGPTRLGVSIKYIIPYSRVKKEKSK